MSRLSTGRTRRIAVLLTVSALILGACGGSDSESGADETTAAPETAAPTTVAETTQAPETTEAAPETTAAPEEPATRTISHVLGDTEVPVEYERIVVLDEYAGVSMITLGIEPTVVFKSFGTAVSLGVLEAAGANLGESALGTANINLEAVAAYDPDIIVGTWDAGMMALYGDLSALAPTVVLPFVDPWRDVVTATGRYFEKEEEAAAVVAMLEERIEEVAAVVAENQMSISILGAFGEMAFTPENQIMMSKIVKAVGLGRPDAQANAPDSESYIIPLSAEVLVDHDADEVVLLSGTVYGMAEPITSAATYESLSAVQAGSETFVSGEMWFGTFGFGVDWVLSDILAIVSGEGSVGTDADGPARWAEFQERLNG